MESSLCSVQYGETHKPHRCQEYLRRISDWYQDSSHAGLGRMAENEANDGSIKLEVAAML